jgi:hypothetical protein
MVARHLRCSSLSLLLARPLSAWTDKSADGTTVVVHNIGRGAEVEHILCAREHVTGTAAQQLGMTADLS